MKTEKKERNIKIFLLTILIFKRLLIKIKSITKKKNLNNSIQSCPERKRPGVVQSEQKPPDDFRQPGKLTTSDV